MRVLIVASEAHPLVKTGGLADVAGALPAALRTHGVDARLVIPAYPGVAARAVAHGETVALGALLGYREVRVVDARLPDGAPVWLIDCPDAYDRAGSPYHMPDGWDHPDNFRRFALLARVAAKIAMGDVTPGWRADVLHANDWQAGLAPAYLALEEAAPSAGDGVRRRPHTVFTIHNLQYQGLFGREVLPMVGLPDSVFAIDQMEFYGLVSFLKAGIVYADRVTTVSPSYAWEITTPEGGRALDGLLAARARGGHLHGLLNGIDGHVWDPLHDPHLPVRYGPEDVAAGKAANKAALQADRGLAPDPDAMLIGVVTRLSEHKGSHLIAGAVHEMLGRGCQLVVLGSGEWHLERAMEDLAAANPGRMSATIAHDEGLSHRIQAAADLLLVPSLFEPCGLTQMYAMRYGTLPLVRRTGGLGDTVVDLADEAHGTGFAFDAPTVEGLLSAFFRAEGFYRRPESWHDARSRGMAAVFGWPRAAAAYVSLYQDLTGTG